MCHCDQRPIPASVLLRKGRRVQARTSLLRLRRNRNGNRRR